jgi:hypothetical protein
LSSFHIDEGQDENPDIIPEREEIIDPCAIGPWYAGLRYFENMPLNYVVILVQRGFLQLDEHYGNAPTVNDFITFGSNWGDYDIRFHGYEVSRSRADCRVVIQGMMLRKGSHRIDNVEFIIDWDEFNKNANECTERRSGWLI